MRTLLALAATFAMHSTVFAQATAADLKKVITDLQGVIAAGKTEEAAKLTGALIPDTASLKKGLGDKVSAEVIGKIEGIYATLPKEPAARAKVLAAKPGYTEIQVHGSTTEELAKYEKDSVAYKEFPGATKTLATDGILRPGTTYFEVEILEPGKDAGMKYHLFFHDGTAWKMLGPIWRVITPPPAK